MKKIFLILGLLISTLAFSQKEPASGTATPKGPTNLQNGFYLGPLKQPVLSLDKSTLSSKSNRVPSSAAVRAAIDASLLAGSQGDSLVANIVALDSTDSRAAYDGIQQYKSYTAILTQSGTSAPTATIVYNSLGGAVTLGYTSTGITTLTRTGAFTSGKTVVFITYASDDATTKAINAVVTSANVITINQKTIASSVANGYTIYIEIRVYN